MGWFLMFASFMKSCKTRLFFNNLLLNCNCFFQFWSVQEECLSPVPPVLMTPGIEQIPSIKETVEQQKASSSSHKSKVARQLRLEMDDPVPPILHTPGIKQITQGNNNMDKPVTSSIRYLTSKVNNFYEDDLEMPKSPQLTYSLKVRQIVSHNLYADITKWLNL